MTERVLDTAPNNPASQAIADLKTTGTKDLFRLISKASSKEMGFMRSTKAMDTGDGVLVQVSTLHRGVPAESVAFVPGVHIEHGPTIDQPYVLVNTATGRQVNGALADEQRASGSAPAAPVDDASDDDEGPAVVEQFPVPKGYADTHVEQLTLALQRQEFVVGASNPHTAYLWDGSNARLEAIKAFCKSLYGNTFNVARLKQKVKTDPACGTLRVGDKHRLRVGDVAILYPNVIDVMPMHEYVEKFVLHYPHRAMVNLLDDNRAINDSLTAYGNQLRDEQQERRILDSSLHEEQMRAVRAENAVMDVYTAATKLHADSTAKLCKRLRKQGSPQRCVPNAAHLKRIGVGPFTASDGTDHQMGVLGMADIVRGDYTFHVVAPMFAADDDGRVRMDSICYDLRARLGIDCSYDISQEEDVLILNGEPITEMQYAIIGIATEELDVEDSAYFVLEVGKFEFMIDDVGKKKDRVKALLGQMKQHLGGYRLHVR